MNCGARLAVSYLGVDSELLKSESDLASLFERILSVHGLVVLDNKMHSFKQHGDAITGVFLLQVG
jgi:S-adenosylmethionine/arginine decarboxylase-like enzyme